jgi:transforming growth factor-beta-induced protein
MVTPYAVDIGEYSRSKEDLSMSTIIDIMRADGRFGNLMTALEDTRLIDLLQSGDTLTIFAPTDDAFGKLSQTPSARLSRDEAHLKRVITHHIVPGKVMSVDLPGLRNISTLAGDELAINVGGSALYVGGAEVQQADIDATNGVIHIIDRVLLPVE